MAGSTRIIDWLGYGPVASLPTAATLDAILVAGSFALYFTSDTGTVYALDRNTVSWIAFSAAVPGDVNGPASSTSGNLVGFVDGTGKNLGDTGIAASDVLVLSDIGSSVFTQRTITGTANRITLTNGDGVSGNPTVDISVSYVGQSTITTLGTITTGTWNGTAIANANLANSTISGIALGSNLANLTATDATLTFSGSYNGGTARTVGLNLDSSNAWTKAQAVTPVALSISAGTVAVDASLSNNFTLTVNANFTLSNPTNLKAGQTLNIWIKQDATGSRVMTLDTWYQAAGGASSIVLSTAANAKDLLTGVSDTTSTITCSLVKAISH